MIRVYSISYGMCHKKKLLYNAMTFVIKWVNVYSISYFKVLSVSFQQIPKRDIYGIIKSY